MSVSVLILLFLFFLLITCISLIMYRDVNPILLVILIISFAIASWGVYNDYDNKVYAKQSDEYTYVLKNKSLMYNSFKSKSFSDKDLGVISRVGKITDIDFLVTIRDLKTDPNSEAFNNRYKSQLKELEEYIKTKNLRYTI